MTLCNILKTYRAYTFSFVLKPYQVTTQKQTTGTINEALIDDKPRTSLWMSIIAAWTGGITLPPRILITKPAPPNFTLSFKPLSAMP